MMPGTGVRHRGTDFHFVIESGFLNDFNKLEMFFF